MKTTIDNNQRVYHVVTSTGKQAFCNIQDLNKVVSEIGTTEGYFKIYHIWNNKPQKLSKKALKEMFAGAQLTQQFNY